MINNESSILFAETRQNRSQKTLIDLMEAAEAIVYNADPASFTSRALSKKAGYSLGTLSKRLTSIEKIFLWAIKKGQEKHLNNMKIMIEKFDPTVSLKTLLEHLIDYAMENIKIVNPKVIQFYEDRIYKHTGVNHFHRVSDSLVPAFLGAMERDQSNTFRKMSAEELKLIVRTTTIFLERPFIEHEEYAGSAKHREIVLQNLIRLMGN